MGGVGRGRESPVVARRRGRGRGTGVIIARLGGNMVIWRRWRPLTEGELYPDLAVGTAGRTSKFKRPYGVG